MVFSRYTAPRNRSFALRLFNAHETEINEHFWSFKVAAEYASFQARAQVAKDPSFPTIKLFKANGPDARRVPATVEKWLAARGELENWLRISALVSASSFLEVYLQQIVRAALMSDPLVKHGSSRILDGVALLKAGLELPFDEEIKALTRGDWTSRINSYRSIFGSPPEFLMTQLKLLERIRHIRNDFAHGFGRIIAPPNPTALKIENKHRLRQETFVKCIGCISKVASEIDKDILNRYIGSFEYIFYYHEWKAGPADPRDAKYENLRKFKRSLQRDAGVSLGPDYCRELVAYYNGV